MSTLIGQKGTTGRIQLSNKLTFEIEWEIKDYNLKENKITIWVKYIGLSNFTDEFLIVNLNKTTVYAEFNGQSDWITRWDAQEAYYLSGTDGGSVEGDVVFDAPKNGVLNGMNLIFRHEEEGAEPINIVQPLNVSNVSNGHIKKDSNWLNAFPWIKVNGAWNRCVIWKKINGVWTKGK